MRPCHFFQHLVGIRRNGRLVSSLFRQFKLVVLHKVHIMQWITFAEVHVTRSVILNDRVGPVSTRFIVILE